MKKISKKELGLAYYGGGFDNKYGWGKYISTFEKHVAKKKLRYTHKIELKNFDLDAFFT